MVKNAKPNFYCRPPLETGWLISAFILSLKVALQYAAGKILHLAVFKTALFNTDFFVLIKIYHRNVDEITITLNTDYA